MRNQVVKNLSIALVVVAAICVGWSFVAAERKSSLANGGSQTCSSDNSGLKLPPGFCATVFADGIGHARDMDFCLPELRFVRTDGWSSCSN
jgi:hypothetical protein